MEFEDLQAGAITRRRFVQLGAATAIASGPWVSAEAGPKEHAARRPMMGVAFEKREPRIAIIGTGGRGTSLLGNLLVANAQVVGLCDIVREKAEAAGAMVVKAGQKQPELYTNGPHDYERMLKRSDIDLVIVATPWLWHAPMALFAMKAGKDVAVEVPGVTTVQECWDIVETSEQTGKHCMMLENCCYG